MPRRPTSDRPLDGDIALAALREQFPDEDFQRAVPLGSGWATDVYLVDDSLVARFPRNAELAGWLDRDEAILELVGAHLGSVLGLPRVWGRGAAGERLPHGFVVCTLVPGVGADSAEAPLAEELVEDLAAALSAIHSLPVEAAVATGLERLEWDDHEGELRFVHGDFSPDNLMVDPVSGRLTGVIDWGNAAIADPAFDFVPLVLWRGMRFAEAVLASYRHPVEDDFLERVRRHARLQALQWLRDTIERRADPELHISWLKNAFGFSDPSDR